MVRDSGKFRKKGAKFEDADRDLDSVMQMISRRSNPGIDEWVNKEQRRLAI